jgi:hypothetical protein
VSELITRTARLAPYAKRPRQASGFVTAYTYEPHPDEPTAGMGNLFIVLEVISSGRMAEEVAGLVIETITNQYYQVPEDKNAAMPDHLERFEAAIKATNAELSHYIDQGNAAWVGKLSAIVAIQAEQELHLTQTGSAEAFLSRGKASTRITAGTGPSGPQPNKTFGAITSGDLEPGDRLLLATPALVHQLPLAKLRSIVASTTPTGAIAEITGLLEGASSMRVAALVIELTTPELAALQMRSDEPDDVVLNPGDTPLDLARQAAAPLAQTAVASSKRLGKSAASGIEAAKPHARRAALWSVKRIRTFLTAKGQNKRFAITAIVVVVIVLIIVGLHSHSSSVSKLKTRFEADLATEQTASANLSNGNKSQAEAQLAATQADLTLLSKNKNLAALNRAVAPNSVASLQQQIGRLLDQAEDLKRVSATTVAAFASSSPTPTHFELVGQKLAVAVDSAGKTIDTIDTTSGSVQHTTANLGAVVATTLSSAGDGVYILTKAPAVWLYKPASNSLVKQTTAEDGWPASKAIASYNSNLYFLGTDSSVQKALPTIAGYGPAAPVLTTTTNPELAGSSTLAVDGSIYVMSNKGLLQYVSGKLQQTVAVPSSLKGSPILRSIGDGTTLTAVNPATDRIGLFVYSSSTLAFNEQFSINGASALYDATINPTTDVVYALINGKLVKFNLH